ncbi:hypothetical protein AB0D14_24600 [Streptomyces sp. NPDC048484]|uniref:hypothetical protein n=1 Tax=Streptomyces sp. NPDC048484 TaxID=3155146 RepID=UPI0034452A9F
MQPHSTDNGPIPRRDEARTPLSTSRPPRPAALTQAEGPVLLVDGTTVIGRAPTVAARALRRVGTREALQTGAQEGLRAGTQEVLPLVLAVRG